jgi:hypothetical protein
MLSQAWYVTSGAVAITVLVIIWDWREQKRGETEQQRGNRILEAIAKHLGVKEDEYAEQKPKPKSK